MALKHRPVEKRFGFTLNYEGFIKFLGEFAPIWEALKLLYEGPVGHTTASREFVERRDLFAPFAKQMLDGKINTYERTICTGGSLMHSVLKYVEGIVDSERVNEVLDNLESEIRKNSSSVWQTHSEEIMRQHALFVQASQNKKSDGYLIKVVQAYNEMVIVVEAARAEAKAEAKARDDAAAEARRKKKEEAEREARAREELARMEKLRIKGENALAQIFA